MHSRSVERQRFANVDILPQTRALICEGEFSEAEQLLTEAKQSDPLDLARARLLTHAASTAWADAADAGENLIELLSGSQISRFEYEFLKRIALCSGRARLKASLTDLSVEDCSE